MTSGASNTPPSANGEPTEKTKEIVRVIEADHKATVEFISRLATLRAGVRGVVITLASALLALAVSQKNWPAAAFGLPIVVASYFTEARMEFLSRLAHDRAVRLERKIQSYISTLVETGTVAGDATTRFRREIETYQFGTSRSLRGPNLKQVVSKSFRDAMTWVYVVFLIALSITAIVVGVGAVSATAATAPTMICVRSGNLVAEVTVLPKVIAGEIIVVPCAA